MGWEFWFAWSRADKGCALEPNERLKRPWASPCYNSNPHASLIGLSQPHKGLVPSVKSQDFPFTVKDRSSSICLEPTRSGALGAPLPREADAL